MPLHIRHYRELAQHACWGQDQWAVLNEAPAVLGVIEKMDDNDWKWTIKFGDACGEIGGGRAGTLEDAKKKFAEAWRAHVKKKGVSEDYLPKFVPQLSELERVRLRLPKAAVRR